MCLVFGRRSPVESFPQKLEYAHRSMEIKFTYKYLEPVWQIKSRLRFSFFQPPFFFFCIFFQREMPGPAGDVVHVSDILKGWHDDDPPRTSSTSTGGAHFSGSGGGGGRGRLGSGGTLRNGRGGGNGSDFGTRPYWRGSKRGGSIAGGSSVAGTDKPGGGTGAKASIVSALERAMSRSTYGGGSGGGRAGEGYTPQPQREKNRSEELFGALMGQDDRGGGKGQGGTGGWGHGGADGAGGGGNGGKGEDGKNNEVDLGFLHRCALNTKYTCCTRYEASSIPTDLIESGV